jgi:hypothetical protein
VVHLEEETQATEGAERGRWRRQLVIKGIAAGKGRGRVLTQRHAAASGEGPGAALGGVSGGPAPVVVREQRARPMVGRHNRGTREGGVRLPWSLWASYWVGCHRPERTITFLIYSNKFQIDLN